MSLQINDTSTYRGIAQVYEKEIGAEYGFITGNTTRYASFIADVNLAWDEFLHLAFHADGKWQFDDSGHTDFPIITTNLVANQRDYTFTTDEGGNLILDIDRVLVFGSDGVYREITPKDAQTEKDTNGFWDGQDNTGSPNSYDKTANGIFLDPIPSANVTDGLKIYINREASYFTTSDTTKKPGCPGLYHRYFAIRPAYDYARRNNLSNLNSLTQELLRLEENIKEGFASRNNDVRKRLIVANESNK